MIFGILSAWRAQITGRRTDAELCAQCHQPKWRTVTRSKHHLVRDRIRLQNQLEALLEEARIKLSNVVQ